MHVRERMVDLLTNVDLELATRVAEGIGVTVDATARGNGAAMKRLQEGWEQFGVTSVPGKPRKSSIERSAAAEHGEHRQGHRQDPQDRDPGGERRGRGAAQRHEDGAHRRPAP